MISIHLTLYAASPPKTAVPKNPVPPLKKEQRNTVLALTVGWYRSARRKISPKTFPLRLLSGRINSIGIRAQNGRAVTTAHLLLHPPLKKIVSALRFWLPNPTSPAGEIVTLRPAINWQRGAVDPRVAPDSAKRTHRARRGGGGSAARVPEDTSTDKLAQNFHNKGRPL